MHRGGDKRSLLGNSLSRSVAVAAAPSAGSLSQPQEHHTPHQGAGPKLPLPWGARYHQLRATLASTAAGGGRNGAHVVVTTCGRTSSASNPRRQQH